MKQGVATFEEPFFLVSAGVAYRSKEKVCLTLGPRLLSGSGDEIVKALNAAYQEGFRNGEEALSKILQKND